MLRNSRFAVIFLTTYLVLYCVFFLYGLDDAVSFMFILSPILVAWMVITILKDPNHTTRELDENEEWGYGDKNREEF